ncbi:glycoside hydrolase [Podospora conica]|nr:glycoside hydrolase [Schizothecium conicum]
MASPPQLPPSENPDRPDYCNEAVFRRNTLPPRSYHIPETSLLLNGRWHFMYSSKPSEAPDNNPERQCVQFLDQPEEWTSIMVPGHWQLQGHGRPHYTNMRFPISVCPPLVPTENPTGTYRRSVRVPSSWSNSSQLRLRFDGVDSAYHVRVNDTLVGYAQGSRNPSEFDITALVPDRSAAINLSVTVYQWSDGTYLEDQDQWWLSGIFRDVHLIAFPPETRIEDWFLRADINGANGCLEASIDIKTSSPADLVVALREQPRHGGKTLASSQVTVQKDGNVKISIGVPAPKMWTAETPYLYTVEMALYPSEPQSEPHIVHQKTGFRRVEIIGGQLCVNGTAVQFRGVNRHDHHSRFGRAVPVEAIRRDLLLMKAHNINALRCSHYPSHPKLYEMADELGLWVIDEADLECHGFLVAVSHAVELPEEMDWWDRRVRLSAMATEYTSNNPSWKQAYLDRITQVVQRDKNHPSIIIWSLGNESFFGENIQAMYDYVKWFDPWRMVHYEGDSDAKSADMFSFMHPSVENLVMLAATKGATRPDGGFDKPIILCAYANAMGNGPGGLEAYETAFRDHPRLQGGFVCQWANHGLWKAAKDGKSYYGYGGDFGDVPNDGDYIMKGLVYSDHRPAPGLLELKRVIQPVKVALSGSKLVLTNQYDFIGLDHLLATYKVEELGEEAILFASGTLPLPAIAAGRSAEIPLPLLAQMKGANDLVLTVSFVLRDTAPWAERGHEVGWFQLRLPANQADPHTGGIPQRSVANHANMNPLWAVESHCGTRMVITNVGNTPDLFFNSQGQIPRSNDGFIFTFDRTRGYLTGWVAGGRPFLECDPLTGAAMIPSFWRAPTNNDLHTLLPFWKRFGVDQLTSQLSGVPTVSSDAAGSKVIKVDTVLSPPGLAWGFEITTMYTISSCGTLKVDVHLDPSGFAPAHVPRIGLNLRVSRDLDRVKWQGQGPGEAYPDKCSAQRTGVWSFDSIDELQTPYEVPQENGNRMGTRWVKLFEPQGSGLRAAASGGPFALSPGDGTQDFNWAASRHGAKALEAARHPCDLVEEDAILLRLDARVAGVGTGACGPGVREEALAKVEPMGFSFVLEALVG